MTFFDVLSLVGGIALFLYGMDVLGKSLEKQREASSKAYCRSLPTAQ